MTSSIVLCWQHAKTLNQLQNVIDCRLKALMRLKNKKYLLNVCRVERQGKCRCASQLGPEEKWADDPTQFKGCYWSLGGAGA